MTEGEKSRLIAWSRELRGADPASRGRGSRALPGGRRGAELDQHLEGIAAIMDSHFRYEERQLLTVLDTLALESDPRDVLGPTRVGPYGASRCSSTPWSERT